MRAAIALLVLGAVAGCRATAKPPTDDMAIDMSVASPDDLAGTDDLAVADMAMCAVGPEICNNGCDDDRNGYTDADDPACTTQMLVTLKLGSPNLSRLILEPTPHLVMLDGNPVNNGGMATFDKLFSPAVFIAYDASTKQLERVVPGGMPTTYNSSFSTRDVCVFNGELIVVEPLATSKLHRMMADGITEIMPPVTLSGQATACSSSGSNLWVARHSSTGPSEVVIFDKGANGPVASALPPIAIPTDLLNIGYDRIVDLVYVKKSGVFLGLFAASGGSADSAVDGRVLGQLAPDGGLGPLVDGGVWHGVGEFMP